MAIITKNPHTWFVATNSSGETQTVFSDETPEHDYPFAYEINFGDSSEPQSSTVTLYNMSKSHRSFYEKKQHVELYFNWGPSRKKIGEGYITKIDTQQHDGVTDSQVITFTEGVNYNNVAARRLKATKKKKVQEYKKVEKTVKGHWARTRHSVPSVETYKRGPKKGQKHTVHHWDYGKKWVKGKTTHHRVPTRQVTKTILVNRVFKKGMTYKQLIEGIAKASGIKIDRIQLVKNPKLKKSFTAKGKPLTLLKQVVKKTGSKLMYERGKLVIVNPKSAKRSWVEIDDQDLVQPPTTNEPDDDDDAKKIWEITIPLIPEITTNTGILMKSKYLKGKFYVKAGQHSSDGTNPQTQCSLVPM